MYDIFVHLKTKNVAYFTASDTQPNPTKISMNINEAKISIYV